MFWFFKKSSNTAQKEEEVVKKEQSTKSSRRSGRRDSMGKSKSSDTFKMSDTTDEKPVENSLLMPTVFEHVNADAPPAVTRMRKHRIFKEEEETTQLNGDKRKSSSSDQKNKKRKQRRSELKKADEKDEARIRQLEEEVERMRSEIGALTLTVSELQQQLTTVHSQLLEIQGLKKKREVLPSTFQPMPIDESWLRSDKPSSMATAHNGIASGRIAAVQTSGTVKSPSAVRPLLVAKSTPKYVIKDYRLIGGKLVPYYVPQLPQSRTALQSAAPSGNEAPKSSDSSKDEKSTYLNPQL